LLSNGGRLRCGRRLGLVCRLCSISRLLRLLRLGISRLLWLSKGWLLGLLLLLGLSKGRGLCCLGGFAKGRSECISDGIVLSLGNRLATR
jgi:hypothetical protein